MLSLLPGMWRQGRLMAFAAMLALMAGLVVAPVARAQTVPPFTVDDMLKLDRVSDPQLSPDGTRVAFVVTEIDLENNGRNNDIWIVPVAGGDAVRLVASPKSDDRPRWSPDGTRLAFVSARDGAPQIYSVAVSGTTAQGEPTKLTSLATGASGVVWSPDGRWLAFVSEAYPECRDEACNARRLKEDEARKTGARLIDGLLFRHWNTWREGRFSHLFVMPADGSGPPRDLTPGAADVPPFSLGGPEDYAFSPDSAEVAFARKTDPVEAISTNSDLFVMRFTDPAAVPTRITTNPGADGGPVYSPDGRYIAYRAQERAGYESDRWRLMVFDRQAGTHRAATADFDRHVDEYVWRPDSSGFVIAADDQATLPLWQVDLGGTPKPIVTGGVNASLQLAADGKTVVFSRNTLTASAEIWRVAADGSGLAAVTRVNDAKLAPFRLRSGESVTYPGAGAAPVQAWIVKPANFDPTVRYPLLFLVHGGPQSAWNDGWSYRWNPQVFASAGYVVFMPNPRGSTSFGQAFIDGIRNDWGGKVFEDLMKGLDYAETLPYVDPERMGAAGASYGGYMMNWFLGHTDRFRALVSHAGVYNLTSMYGVTEELWFVEWEFEGTPWTNLEAYEKWSPHRYADRFATPTLVIHGELDFRVPVGEGFQLFTTLQRRGVPSRLLYFPDEGHWINRPQNSALWYRTFIDWMNQWVKGQ